MRPDRLTWLSGAVVGAIAGLGILSTPALAADSDGMFGIHMGEDIAALSVAGVIEPHLYRLMVVDKPDHFFPYYQVRYHPATGVCMAAAVTDMIIDSGAGEELHRQFAKIKTELEQQYGETKTIDRVIPNNQGEWRRHFLNFLKDDKAILAARWTYNNGHKLGPEKREILLVAEGISSSQAAIILQVKFNNYNECIRAMQREKDSPEAEMPEPTTVHVYRGNQHPEPKQAEDKAATGKADAAAEAAKAAQDPKTGQGSGNNPKQKKDEAPPRP